MSLGPRRLKGKTCDPSPSQKNVLICLSRAYRSALPTRHLDLFSVLPRALIPFYCFLTPFVTPDCLLKTCKEQTSSYNTTVPQGKFCLPYHYFFFSSPHQITCYIECFTHYYTTISPFWSVIGYVYECSNVCPARGLIKSEWCLCEGNKINLDLAPLQ